MSGEIEIQILACPPVSPAARMQLGMSNFRASPGAVEWECERCRQSVWLGLKGQERKRANPGALVACFLCACKLGRGEKMEVGNLGGVSSHFDFNPDAMKLPQS